MRFLRSSVACLALAALAKALQNPSNDEKPADNHVISLDSSTFNDAVAGDLMLVKFYAPWCGYCKELAPHYENAAAELIDKVKLAEVDCSEHAELCEENEVRGFPTLKVFRKGISSDYNGGRVKDDIVSYMKRQLLPTVSEITAENLDSFSTSHNVVVVSFLKSNSSGEYQTFQSIADALRDEVSFGVSLDSALAEKHKVKVPGVILYKQFDEKQVIYNGKFDTDELKSFIKAEAIPIMAEIGVENYALYAESPLPLAFFFYDNEEDRKNVGSQIEKVAKDYRKQVNFVYIDASKFGGHAETLGLQLKWPAFSIHQHAENLKYPFNQSMEITEENIRNHVDDFVNNKLKPLFKSEDVPESNDGPVKVVVGTTFEELVMDKTKDVLIEFYAPWCGFCKSLAPIYDNLGKKFANLTDKILITKMDATENDIPRNVPIQVEGFPTIKLVKAETNEVVDFHGNRTAEEFVEFLRENAFYNDFVLADETKVEKEKSDEKTEDHEEL